MNWNHFGIANWAALPSRSSGSGSLVPTKHSVLYSENVHICVRVKAYSRFDIVINGHTPEHTVLTSQKLL